MGRRILNEALSKIVNAERRNKSTVELQPISTVMSSFLNIMKYRGNNTHIHVIFVVYIGESIFSLDSFFLKLMYLGLNRLSMSMKLYWPVGVVYFKNHFNAKLILYCMTCQYVLLVLL